jgi:predicted nucleic acid-binding Zn ribbon protein
MTFKINYKGAGLPKPYDYFCKECGYECVFEHTCKELKEEDCPECGTRLVRHIKTAPKLGAEFHEGSKFRNLGWDEGE